MKEKIRKEVWFEPDVFEKVKVKSKDGNRTPKAYIENLVIEDVKGVELPIKKKANKS